MDILSLIKKDHKEVMGLIEQIEKQAEGGKADATDLVRQLMTEILLHAKTEQIAFYKPISEQGEEFKDFALEGKIEHKLVEVTMNKLAKHQPGEDEFKATLSVVKDLIEHHAMEEEEEELFPKVEKAIDKEMLAQMGERFEALKEKVRPRIEEQVTQAMSGMLVGDTAAAQVDRHAH